MQLLLKYFAIILILFFIFIALSVFAIKRKRRLLLFISIVTATAISLPFLIIYTGPSIWWHYELRNLQTTISKDGICIQTTGFTCGPGVAVTILRHLGIDAKENDLAIYSKCTPKGGTTKENLVKAIEKLYGKEGVECSFLDYDSIDQLKDFCPCIAAINLSSAVSHYTVVLEVTENKIVIGDPIGGKKEWSHEDFKNKCWPTAIILKRTSEQ